jgi:hypothetical protein
MAWFFRDGSKPTMDEASLAPAQCDYYCAIFEFAQGSFPLTIWENDADVGQRITADRDSFRLSVVNTPTNIQSSPTDSRPIVIRSSFQGTHYIALFIQILDIQARGFTRPLVFVVANRIAEIVDWLASRRRTELLCIGERLQAGAWARFPSELKNYALALRDVIRSPGGEPALASKFVEMATVIKAFNIELEDSDDVVFEKRPPEYFTTINNDLRKMAQMIDLEKVKLVILEFVKALPTSMFQVNVLARSGLGVGQNPQAVIAAFTAAYDPEAPAISHQRFFHDLLFVLLSGQTLVLQTDKMDHGVSVAARLAVLSPFSTPFSQGIVDVAGVDALKYSIVVSREIKPEFSGLPIWSLDSGKYDGGVAGVCPAESVLRGIQVYPNERDNYTVICASNNVKRIFSKFRTKLAEARTRPLHTQDDMMKALSPMGFHPGDIPLFKYWLTCLASTQRARPILLAHLGGCSI